MKNLPRSRLSGQALLIMILAMAVALTIGLAVVSRSITDIQISTEQEESARVFSVAEAGIEEALKANFAAPQDVTITVGDAEITAHVIPSDFGGQTKFVFPKEVSAGETETVWLIGHDDTTGEVNPTDSSGKYQENTIGVYWGNEGTDDDANETPALAATVFYKETGEFKTKKFALDPNLGRRSPCGGTGNCFDNVDGIGNYAFDDKTLRFYEELNLPSISSFLSDNGYYFLRLKLLYNETTSHLLGIEGTGGASVPLQGRCYDSIATLPDSGVTKWVQHCQPYKVPPGIFDYVLYSAGDLAK